MAQFVTQCFECGKEFAPDGISGDLCPQCASNARAELTLSFEFTQIWNRCRKWSPAFPVITPLMMAIMVAIYWYVARDPARRNDLEAMLAMETPKVLHDQVWRLVTSNFLHIRLQHLEGNLISLSVLGSLTEMLFGPSRLLLIWLATGTAGSIAELLGYNRAVISYGASTVEYGLLGVLLSVYLFRQVGSSKTRIAMVVSLVTWTLAGLLGDALLRHKVIPGHIGGLIAGLLLPVVVSLKSERTMASPE